MKLKGERVTLTPIAKGEKEEFFKLATQSYGSKFWYDNEKKLERKREEFFKEWSEVYFDDSDIERGQCFWIIVDGKRIGQVNSNKIDKWNKRVEIDIIIGPKERLGRGYGPEALKLLIKYLFDNFDLNKVWIEARGNNSRAIKAYEKVGFKKEGLLRKQDYFEGDFVDCIRFGLLRDEFKN